MKIFVGVFSVVSMLLASTAAAQMTGSLGYSHFDEEVSLGALQVTFGYELPVIEGGAGTGYFIPELRVGYGITDDTIMGVKFEIDNYYGIAPRFQYEGTGGVYGFLQGSYINYKMKASAEGFSASDSSWEFGIGAGVGVFFSEKLGTEISYENVDGEDLFNISMRFRF